MRPDGFAVLRTPLLPFDDLLRLSEAPADRAAVLGGIERLLARPDVRDAIALASPSLAAALDDRPPGQPLPEKLARAAYRYLARMCTRPTPFGLFAGTSLCRAGGETALTLAPRERQRRSTTVDPQILTAVAEALAADPQVRERVEHRPNSSLYALAGSARYARARTDGARRSYELAAAELTPALAAVIERAREGATPAELAAVLTEGGADPAAAAGFVDRVIGEQILVADLVPPVTGSDPLTWLTERLAALGLPLADTLREARRRLDEIDRGGVGAAAGGYGAVVDVLRALPGGADPARGLVADLVRALDDDAVGRDVMGEVRRAVELAARVGASGGGRSGPLAEWRAAFEARYETREVPLMEALDEELGIGFQPSTAPSAGGSPLLRGLPWGATMPDRSFDARGRRLLALVDRARTAGAIEVELTDADVAALEGGRPAAAPDALSAMVTVAQGEDGPRVLLHGASGPSGARMLGRICHADPSVAEAVRGHLGREQALRPDAVFAEIVHLPEGSTGKLIARPLLREHEIEYLGRSGAPGALGVDDLLVSVRGDRIVLRSHRLGREVLPRLTSAHNYGRPGTLGVYRFLGALQSQGRAAGLTWSWGALDGAPFLPRVRRGRIVLSRARWNLPAQAFRDDDLRARHGLPRWVAVADADNELVVDLENVLAVDVLRRLAAAREEVGLVEVWPEPDGLCVRGADGRYAHELVIPFVAERAAAAPPSPRTAAPPDAARAFLPGSEWLYAKLYTGQATADALLRDLVAPLVAGADRWFFLRYGDPDWHLRLRMRGDAGALLPALHAAAERERAAGRLWRLELGTYEREIERYGGAAAIDACEEIFQADSEAALAIVAAGASQDRRWRLALAGVSLLLEDLVEEPGRRRELVTGMRDAYAREHDAGRALFRAVGERWRAEGRQLLALLEGDAELPGLEVLRERSRRMAPAVARLRALEAEGALTAPLAEVAGSLVHMHVNRLVRSDGRAHELVLLDLLARAQAAQAAGAGL